jgi:hypothetical protein
MFCGKGEGLSPNKTRPTSWPEDGAVDWVFSNYSFTLYTTNKSSLLASGKFMSFLQLFSILARPIRDGDALLAPSSRSKKLCSSLCCEQFACVSQI